MISMFHVDTVEVLSWDIKGLAERKHWDFILKSYFDIVSYFHLLEFLLCLKFWLFVLMWDFPEELKLWSLICSNDMGCDSQGR